MNTLYTKPILRLHNLRVTDAAWKESQNVVQEFRMTRDNYINLANTLIRTYFEELTANDL